LFLEDGAPLLATINDMQKLEDKVSWAFLQLGLELPPTRVQSICEIATSFGDMVARCKKSIQGGTKDVEIMKDFEKIIEKIHRLESHFK
jgi:hypothetical protein